VSGLKLTIARRGPTATPPYRPCLSAHPQIISLLSRGGTRNIFEDGMRRNCCAECRLDTSASGADERASRPQRDALQHDSPPRDYATRSEIDVMSRLHARRREQRGHELTEAIFCYAILRNLQNAGLLFSSTAFNSHSQAIP
jgi:hypothetical protein